MKRILLLGMVLLSLSLTGMKKDRPSKKVRIDSSVIPMKHEELIALLERSHADPFDIIDEETEIKKDPELNEETIARLIKTVQFPFHMIYDMSPQQIKKLPARYMLNTYDLVNAIKNEENPKIWKICSHRAHKLLLPLFRNALLAQMILISQTKYITKNEKNATHQLQVIRTILDKDDKEMKECMKFNLSIRPPTDQ